MKLQRNLGSFRDPSGQIYEFNKRIIRIIKKSGAKRYNHLKSIKIIEESIDNGFLIQTKDVTDEFKKTNDDQNNVYYLEHERLDYISYPYEWSFYQLKDAALHHLNFQLFLLDRDCVLIDSSAFNIQFNNNKPIFIDLLSLDKYESGDYWKGHSQFLKQFLNPLLLKSLKGIDYNNWYKGNLDGIATTDLNKLLSLKNKFSINVLISVTLLSKLDKNNKIDPQKALVKIKNKKKLSKNSYKSILLQLKKWILKLKPKEEKTVWDSYSKLNTYKNNEQETKLKLINEFSKKYQPNLLADVGCNDGVYSFESINAGAKKVVGFDIDLNSLNRAYLISKKKNLNFLPIYLDAMNPSANLGWNENERLSFNKRMNFDCMIALAFEHHLALANNVPLNETVNWLVSIAPYGLIEFVEKEDETVKRMLSLKGDIFPNYNMNNFEKNILLKCKIKNKTQISKTRFLYEFSKD